MNLGALDSISAHLVSYAEIRERSPASISTISKRQVDRLHRFPVRMKQALLRELEWLEGLVQCVTGSMTSLSSIPVSP